MLRFATSPTGDMHIGNLRVALFNYIIAKQRKEDFIVRIEDIDKEKNIEGKDKEILDILDLFNISYSQVIYQSESIRFHSAMALQLIHEKKAFSCFCSSNWLDKKRKEAISKSEIYKYDDACRNLPAELVIDNLSPFTIRINRPQNSIVINDKLKGKSDFEPDTVDSFTIMHQNKMPTYNFSSAVDDMLNDISMVIRTDEHIENTPKQEHIRNSLSYDKKIEYAHIPVIVNDVFSVKFLLEEGYLPEAISNYLISTGNNTPQNIFTLSDAIKWFDLSKISDSPTSFDINILREINKEHLKNLDSKELSRYVGFADEEIGDLAKVYLEEASTTKELRTLIEPIFSKKIIPEELQDKASSLATIIKSAPYFKEYSEFKAYILEVSKVEETNFTLLLRLLLTGATHGPDIMIVYKYLKNYIGEIIK